MNFNQYQERAKEFAQYDYDIYPFLALSEEVGEFIGIMAKYTRGDDLITRYGTKKELRDALAKEAGDILWQLTACLTELGMSLQEVAQMNILKLEDRKNRGVIKSHGNDR